MPRFIQVDSTETPQAEVQRRSMPSPINGTQEYLAGILDELVAMRAELVALRKTQDAPQLPEGTVELREPSTSLSVGDQEALDIMSSPTDAHRRRMKRP